MTRLQNIEIAIIKTHGLQTRAELSNETIKEYIEASEGGAVFPPIAVYFDKTDYWLADGFHRLEAARRMGWKKIRAHVEDGDRVAALKCALGANSAHGLRRTNADKQHAVKMAYENRISLGLGEVPAASAVAKMCGVSQPMALDQLKNFLSWTESQKRTGADGRTRSLPPSRPPSSPPMRPHERTNPSSNATNPPGLEVPRAAFTPPTKPSIRIMDLPKDPFGIPIPPQRIDAWNRRDTLKELANQIAAVRRAVQLAQDSKDPVFTEVNFSILVEADRFKTELAKSVPWCVCPMCQGHEGCKTCKGSGLLSKFAYENFVPKEFKRKTDH